MAACESDRLMKSQYVALSMSLMLASMPTAVRSFCTACASLGNGSTLWPTKVTLNPSGYPASASSCFAFSGS